MGSSLRLALLFDKYLHRLCTPAELEEMISLLQQGNAEETLTAPLLELWQKFREERALEPETTNATPVDWDKMYRIVTHSEQDLADLQNQRNLSPAIGWRRVAAAVIILVLGSAAWWYARRGNEETRNPGLAVNNRHEADAGEMPGKRQIIHLPDGSTVILNENSKLGYPASFNGRTREVSLTGEAWFDIRQDPIHPFLVHTGRITTRVMGTSFDIRAYGGEETIAVTVTSGKVQVLRENKSLGLLGADQQISFSPKTGEVRKLTVDARSLVAWKPAEMVMNDLSMQEVADRLEQRFAMVIGFANPAIKDCRVTATFSTDDNLAEILTVVCGVSGSSYSIQNNKIIIDGKGCN